MHATVEQHRRKIDPGALVEDLAIVVLMLSGAILVVALIVAAFVI
jgi:hypothetical protein